ncbi:MAG: rhodanese-like domain-containing protein [Actinobacteria bacterium]|nr:rhodanese-like domain-containing protein [Actinomycetota bacterium]
MNERPPEVDLETLARALETSAALIDVRRPDEYAEKRIPGARLIPLDELANRMDEIPTGETVYVVCASGGRSLTAAAALNQAGWDAVSVAGGTNKWAEEGRSIETGP